jgi:hypothetical protein
VVARETERLRVEVPVHGVAEEQAAEEHHLGREERPHPEARGLVLLLEVLEVVREAPRPGRGSSSR